MFEVRGPIGDCMQQRSILLELFAHRDVSSNMREESPLDA